MEIHRIHEGCQVKCDHETILHFIAAHSQGKVKIYSKPMIRENFCKRLEQIKIFEVISASTERGGSRKKRSPELERLPFDTV